MIPLRIYTYSGSHQLRKGAPVNATPLLSRFHDDPDFRELLEEFVLGTADRASALSVAYASGQWDEVRRQAHQIKGAGGGYGYDSLSEVAADLEQACRSESLNPDTIANALERVLDHLQRVVV